MWDVKNGWILLVVELNKLKLSQLHNRMICAIHFEEKHFTSTLRIRLSKFAVPTLNLNREESFDNQPDKRMKYINIGRKSLHPDDTEPHCSENEINFEFRLEKENIPINLQEKSCLNSLELIEENVPVKTPDHTVELTPKTRRINLLCVKVSKMRKKLIASGPKIACIPKILESLKQKLTYSQYILVASFLRQSRKKPNGWCWTSKEKSLAFSIYH